MKIIKHRLNTIEELQSCPVQYGVEVDIRSAGSDLIIHHDPFMPGVSFKEWLTHYRHSTLILNVKEEGLEPALVTMMEKHSINDYFFLDQSFPFLLKWANKGLRKSAVRVSEMESLQTALNMAGKVDWIWVDCFTTFPLSREDADKLIAAGFKLCLVSPELHGRDAKSEIPAMKKLLTERGIKVDAVCSKYPELWEA